SLHARLDNARRRDRSASTVRGHGATCESVAPGFKRRIERKIMKSAPLQQNEDGSIVLGFCNTDSLGERIQKAFPSTRVVKALNTVNCDIMIEPSRVPGDHNLFICDNDAAAKKRVTQYLSDWFGWKPDNIIDVGDITPARGTEMMMPLWMRLFQSVIGHPHFNWQIVRGH